MPDLAEENSTLAMHGFYNWLPGFHLFSGPYTWRVRVPLSSLRDASGLSDQKSTF
jgi:hypothetical protein